MIHHNLPWTESPFFENELAAADLSQQQKAFVKSYADDGYIVFDTQLDESVIEAAKTVLEYSYIQSKQDKPNDKEAGYKLQDAWQYNTYVKQIASAPKILEVLRLLYKRRPIPFQTLNFKAGSEQHTHSDMIHFSSMPERFMCGVWVALEDITEESGPLHYYPGSHKLPFYDMSALGIKASKSVGAENVYMDYEDHYVLFIEEMIKSLNLQKKSLLIKKGQCMIWSANLLHGGDSIARDGSTRHSQVTHYYFEDCTYFTPLFTDFVLKQVYLRYITDITTGERIENKYLGDVVKEMGTKEKLLSLFSFTKRFTGK